MLKNNKGFTVIELIMSFLFASILAISLFSVIVSYRDVQTDASIESQLMDFKSHLMMDIERDIQLKGLKEIIYCPSLDEHNQPIENAIIPRCLILSFNDNTTKEFRIREDPQVDILDDGSQFNYTLSYVTYGDIRYEIPDATNVFIEDDYILQTSSLYDGLETGTRLYKIEFNLNHSDLDSNIVISIVANGTLADSATSGSYRSFDVGNEVYVQLNKTYQKKFRVIKYSSSFEDSIKLLYDDSYDSSLVYNSTQFNELMNNGNRYDGSIVSAKIESIKYEWTNADEVRLITIDEVASLASTCPQYRGTDSSTVSLASAPSWLVNKSYWTMSQKLLSNDNNGKQVWYVNGSSKVLDFDFVNKSYALRPVIVISKHYITN